MIRDAILHLNNEQPLMADLYELPGNGDVGLRLTNLRGLDGKRPVFVDDVRSIFFFPYLHIRFVEIPPAALRRAGLVADEEAQLEGVQASGPAEPAPVTVPADATDESDLEIDEDFLRRIREV